MTFRQTIQAYNWRVWAGWIAVLILVVPPVALLAAALAGEGSGSARQAVLAAIWIFTMAGTAIYFEFINSRRRRSAGLKSNDSTALTLAVVALIIGITFLLLGGPLALLLAVLAWRRFRRSTQPYASGLASAAVASLVGAVDTIYLVLVLTGYLD